MDYEKIAQQIVASVGGPSNVKSVTHCMTRLRFVLKDDKKADTEALNKISGVMGSVFGMGQLQIVMGPNLIPTFNEVIKQNDFEVADIVDENLDEDNRPEPLTWRNAGSKLIGFIGGSVTPIVPVLIAGGMLKVFLLLIGLVWAAFDKTQTYTLLSMLANTPFYFLPIFVAYGAAKRLNASPIYAMIVALFLVYPDFMAMVTAGKAVTIVGLPVLLVNYSNSLLPALLSTIAVAYLEKFFTKIVPGIFKAVFVGPFTIAIAGILTLVVLGPLGTYVGNYIVGFLDWMYKAIGPVSIAVLAGGLPFLIMTGMHTLFGPFMVQSLAGVGYDGFFRPALILHNMAEGGACFAVALRTKNQDLRSEAFSCGIGAIFAGVTEPAIYGITIRLKKPLYGVMAGGAIGGLLAGLLGAKAFVMGYSSILAIPIFESTIIAIVVGIAAAIAVAFIVTFVIGFDDIKD